MILCDLPYGTTACKWDIVIPLEPLWEQYNRIIKDCGAIVLFGKEPFLSLLITSNLNDFKYSIAWKKSQTSGFVNAKLKPINTMEYIAVFSNGATANGSKRNMHYYPQGLTECNRIKVRKLTGTYEKNSYQRCNSAECNGGHLQKFTGYPTDFVEFSNGNVKDHYHPTQKPVELCEYLIKTYTKENEVVLDNCMGSGTTAVAAINTNRNYIGFELDTTYCDIANKRIQDIV